MELRYQKIKERKRKKAKPIISDLSEIAPFFAGFPARIPTFFSTGFKSMRNYSPVEGSLSRALLSTLSFISPPASIMI